MANVKWSSQIFAIYVIERGNPVTECRVLLYAKMIYFRYTTHFCHSLVGNFIIALIEACPYLAFRSHEGGIQWSWVWKCHVDKEGGSLSVS